MDGYRIITKSSTGINFEQPQGLTTGGVAILIHNDLEQHITHIEQINNRTMHLTLQSNKTHTPITILNTYAPDNSKGRKEQKEHWQKVKEVLGRISKKHIIIWRTDANEQIGKIKQSEQDTPTIIGNNTNLQEAEKGNRKMLTQIC